VTSFTHAALNPALLAARMEQVSVPSPLVALTSGLARGDDDAWAEFHRSYGPGIFRQLLAAAWGNHDVASEALQQTYLRVAKHARLCDSAPMFAGWLRVVARSALNDCLRRRRSFWQLLHRRAEDPTDLESSTEQEDRLLATLDMALATLDPDDRALLEAKYFSGTDVRTIAAQLAISPKATESRLTRARAQLRERLLAALPRHD
jgi:RNA polymerase sigma-70 factor, ECF subfamily